MKYQIINTNNYFVIIDLNTMQSLTQVYSKESDAIQTVHILSR